MKPISEVSASGKVLVGDEIVNRNETVKSEVRRVLEKHDLTIGQAISLLDECGRDIFTEVCQAHFRA